MLDYKKYMAWKKWALAMPQGVRFVIGGSIGLRHIRPPHDLDMLVSPHDWNRLVDTGKGVIRKATSGDDMYCIGEHIECFAGSWPRGFGYGETAHNADVVEILRPGYSIHEPIKVWTLQQTLAWKRAFGREKDLRDIALVEGRRA